MVGSGRNKQYSNYLDSWTKRCFDIIISILLLPAATIIMAFVGLSILIREGRPILFVQHRAGKNGRLFLLPKLRTLLVNADPYKLSTEFDKEPFVTVIGKSLRKHRIDELPQLFSVLHGNMSLVGPRPEMPNVTAGYRGLERKRLSAKPGITGLWQVMADRNTGVNHDIKYDLYYLRKASLRLDIKILLMTIVFVLNPK
jgi:lipopolysaccharide/colanic/teichoic acid biosynthesis glycosyltransferase